MPLSDPAPPSLAFLPLWLRVVVGKPHQENERLRTQALKKAKEEKEQNTKKESELLVAKRELEVLTKQHQKLSKKLLKYSLFKRYLENVVENSQVSLDVAQGGPYLGVKLEEMRQGQGNQHLIRPRDSSGVGRVPLQPR